ncbi:MAG: hypothetical protein JW768_07420 [Chitinispirillaceae bacterium]|nr:hypothetical protein [Chitinispirillaceae bacterium]
MMYVIAAVLFASVLAVLFFVYNRSTSTSRPLALKREGAGLNLDYTEKDNTILEKLKFYNLYDAATLQASAANVLRSRISSPDIWIFDYHALTGPEPSGVRTSQTVIYLSDPRMKVPRFRLFPARADVGKRTDVVFKYRPIPFADAPRFSAQYRLVGPDEHDIRELFQPGLIAYCEKLKGVCVEGYGNELIMYYRKILVKPKCLARFYQNAHSLFQLVIHHSKRIAAAHLNVPSP